MSDEIRIEPDPRFLAWAVTTAVTAAAWFGVSALLGLAFAWAYGPRESWSPRLYGGMVALQLLLYLPVSWLAFRGSVGSLVVPKAWRAARGDARS